MSHDPRASTARLERTKKMGLRPVIVLDGDLVLGRVVELGAQLDIVEKELSRSPMGRMDLAVSPGTRWDGAGAALVAQRLRAWRTEGWDIDLSGLPPAAMHLMSLEAPVVQAPPVACKRFIFDWRELRRNGIAVLETLGAVARGTARAIRRPRQCDWAALPEQLRLVGADAVTIVVVINVLVGMIIGFQGVVQLQLFGVDLYVADMVAIGHLRELGPLMTAVVVAGRSGAGFAAEFGTKRVNEEVDALRVMGIDPWSWLFVPRCAALLIALPLLTLMGDICGIIGGMIAALPLTELTARTYLLRTTESVARSHLLIGLSKSVLFAAAIAIIACAQGLAARGGAADVGRRTTRAVVLAILALIVINTLTAVFTSFWGI